MTITDEHVHIGVQRLKARFLGWRVPPIELPAESIIEDAAPPDGDGPYNLPGADVMV